MSSMSWNVRNSCNWCGFHALRYPFWKHKFTHLHVLCCLTKYCCHVSRHLHCDVCLFGAIIPFYALDNYTRTKRLRDPVLIPQEIVPLSITNRDICCSSKLTLCKRNHSETSNMKTANIQSFWFGKDSDSQQYFKSAFTISVWNKLNLNVYMKV